MLEFFVIMSKSGIVLFATVNQSLNTVVNGLVEHVFLEERPGHYQTDQLQLKYLLDNEFELVFVVGYQKFLQLSYVDKFLTDVKLAFRDKYSDFDLRKILNLSFSKRRTRLLKMAKEEPSNYFADKSSHKTSKRSKLKVCDLDIDEGCIVEFHTEFGATYESCVKKYASAPRQETMRTFQDSAKSKKTIASMIVQPTKPEPTSVAAAKPAPTPVVCKPPGFFHRKGKTVKDKPTVANADPSKKTKNARQWDLSGSNPEEFDFSKKSDDPRSNEDLANNGQSARAEKYTQPSSIILENAETNLKMTDDESSDDDEGGDHTDEGYQVQASRSSYLNSIWKTISYNKTLSEEDLQPVLDQLRDHLTAKNVAASIAQELCDSVCIKLKGQQINTWTGLKKVTRDALENAILGILNTGNSINILREIQAKARPPYVIVFCGVNGVGKSTNLAKIANWLINNQVKVLVIACDTFRAGAIEQLKTHVMALKSIHERGKKAPVKIELFEKGYGKDSAAIAMEGINYARNNGFNCVMVDTAGRMQDNEPLMKQLAKLIAVNSPDLTLFVGEALVGNEAVDQLTRFNDSLVENGCRLAGSKRSAINGIVLTKFDTIDDQVGAAISMTYVTSKPIVFVGVGQTYKDLKQLDAKAVTRSLMR